MDISRKPDIDDLEIPMDAWTEPFWYAADAERLVLPRCGDCAKFRWPPGPFCPCCQSQTLRWEDPGVGRVYSYTMVPATARNSGAGADAPAGFYVPALIEFPGADDVRLLAAIVDTPLQRIRIGAEVSIGWSKAGNGKLPVFYVR